MQPSGHTAVARPLRCPRCFAKNFAAAPRLADGKTLLVWAVISLLVFCLCALSLGLLAYLEVAYHFGHQNGTPKIQVVQKDITY